MGVAVKKNTFLLMFMISREEALEMLERAAGYEEKLIQDLEAVFGQLISRMRLSPEQDALMREYFKKLVSESREHEQEFNELLDYVREGEKDEY